ncbi:MAG: alpha-galactosidase [Verrucomicrobiota bacterium]
MCDNRESRKPYIFYNTWNYQERNQDWNKKTYLDSMNESRILKEIEVAHQIGVDVFVIDTGWYEKTGDWQVDRQRFSDNLKKVKRKLDDYGMKLGLWFNPTVAAVSSQMFRDHQDCVMTLDGVAKEAFPVWETEASMELSLVSRYRKAFTEELIRLVEEVGVSYFKWDAIAQYGSNSANHEHGTEKNSAQERSECYAFELARAMTRIVEDLTEACPEAIVDFDVTEGGRCVGLGFLAAGKYFLINNGPYYENFDVPVPEGRNVNLFFFPGPARDWVCRSTLTYDDWIPSILFLTHYFPDDPSENQLGSVASLILGHNGIWGDLCSISEDGVTRMRGWLSLYKKVRNEITSSYPVRTGIVAGSPEIYEKICERSGKGAVVFFASKEGDYTYHIHNLVAKSWEAVGPLDVLETDSGKAVIHFRPKKSKEAAIAFFGI